MRSTRTTLRAVAICLTDARRACPPFYYSHLLQPLQQRVRVRSTTLRAVAICLTDVRKVFPAFLAEDTRHLLQPFTTAFLLQTLRAVAICLTDVRKVFPAFLAEDTRFTDSRRFFFRCALASKSEMFKCGQNWNMVVRTELEHDSKDSNGT